MRIGVAGGWRRPALRLALRCHPDRGADELCGRIALPLRRRDRYEIPDWQRDEVWNRDKKQRLIDSILRGWKIPKFYLIKASESDYLVEDGQQRFVSILEFFSNELPLSDESAKRFGGRF